MSNTTISLTFTPAQLADLRSHFSPQQFTNHVEIANRIDSAIAARDYWDSLTDDQRQETLDTVEDCQVDDVDAMCLLMLLTDPTANEINQYLYPEED